GRHGHFLIGLGDVELGPLTTRRHRQTHVESAEEVVEHAIHFAMQGQEGAAIVVAIDRGGPVVAAPPGNEITHTHRWSPFIRLGTGPAVPGGQGLEMQETRPPRSDRTFGDLGATRFSSRVLVAYGTSLTAEGVLKQFLK